MSFPARRRTALAPLAAGLVALVVLLAGPSFAADPEAPHHAPAHWLPNEEWVWQHWLPFDEQRLYALLRIDRRDLWHQLRDDTHTVAALGARSGLKPRSLADALVEPRRRFVSPAKFRELRTRSFRTLTQGHLAQHIFFHSLHQSVIPNRAPLIFGVRSTNEFQRLRRAELSPLQIARLYGRSRVQVQQAATAALRERVRAGIRGGDVSAGQATILFNRQLRQLPRWLGQARYNGPPPLYRNPSAIAKAKDYANNASISGDGRRIAFEVYESSIPLAKRKGEISVRTRDAGAPHSRLASLASKRHPKSPRSAYNASISANGRYIAYESAPGNLNFAKRYGGISVVARDLNTDTLIRVDPRNASDVRRMPRSSYNPSTSADGRHVAFESSRQVRGSGRNAFELGVFVRDLRARRTIPVRVAGPKAGRDASEPQISGDGRYVAFTSTARRAGDDSPSQVLLQELGTGRSLLVSRADGIDGETASGESYEPRVSHDGRYVAFTSTASNLDGRAGRGSAGVFVRDLRKGETTLVSDSGGDDGPPANAFSFGPAISASGRFIAFASVVPGRSGVAGRESQVFLHDMRSGNTKLVSRGSGGDGSPSEGFSYDPVISADGRFVAFTSDAPNLSDRKFDLTRGIFLRDTRSSETALVSKGFTIERSNTRRILALVAVGLLAAVGAGASRVFMRRRRRPAPAAAG